MQQQYQYQYQPPTQMYQHQPPTQMYQPQPPTQMMPPPQIIIQQPPSPPVVVSNVSYRQDDRPNHLLHCIITLFCPWWILVWLCMCCCYGC